MNMKWIKEYICSEVYGIKKEISKYGKLMAVQMIFALLLYLVLIANQLTNHYDGLWSGSHYVAWEWELSIGRWFWFYIDQARLGISAEPTTSILTLALISMGNLLIVSIFDVVEEKAAYLACLLILSSTTVCNWLSYRYMSPTFGVSYLLGIFAAWILAKKVTGKEKGVELFWLSLSVCAVALSLGLYQANLACTCVLLSLHFLLIVLIGDGFDARKLLYRISASLSTLALGCLLYKGIWDIHMAIKKVAASGYNGADSLSVRDMLDSLPQSVRRSYLAAYNYFFQTHIKHNVFQQYGLYRIVLVVFLSAFFAMCIRRNRKKILFLPALFLLPMACNASLFLATKMGGNMIQMTGGLIILFPCLVCVLRKGYRSITNICVVQKAAMWFCMAVCVIMLYGNIYMVTTDIAAMYEGKKGVETMVGNAVVQLQSMNQYDLNKTYMFVGAPANNAAFVKTGLWNRANGYAQYGQFWISANCSRMAYQGVLRDLGTYLPYAADENYSRLVETETVRNMPVYPYAGYIQEIDNCIVIKISDNY